MHSCGCNSFFWSSWSMQWWICRWRWMPLKLFAKNKELMYQVFKWQALQSQYHFGNSLISLYTDVSIKSPNHSSSAMVTVRIPMNDTISNYSTSAGNRWAIGILVLDQWCQRFGQYRYHPLLVAVASILRWLTHHQVRLLMIPLVTQCQNLVCQTRQN